LAIFRNEMEMTMRKKTIALIVVPLISALSAQAAVASERHHARTKARPVACGQSQNSNAYYAAPGYFAGPSYFQEDPSYLRSEDNGAMASGPAGH
jgi:hypothetical protein